MSAGQQAYARWYSRHADPGTRPNVGLLKSLLRRHQPIIRPDQAAEVWHAFADNYEDTESALGQIVAALAEHGWLE